MATTETVASLKARLDDLDQRLSRARERGALGAAHEAQAKSIGAGAQALREKISIIPVSTLESVRHDLHEDWRILLNALETWERDVDARFRRR